MYEIVITWGIIIIILGVAIYLWLKELSANDDYIDSDERVFKDFYTKKRL